MSALGFHLLALFWLFFAIYALFFISGDDERQERWVTRAYIMLCISAVYTVGGTIVGHLT